MSDRSYTPELIADAIRGDDTALSFLYESTQDKVTQTVRSMIRDEDAVLDIVQDSFVKAFRNLDNLDKPEYFLAWMRRIATNTAVDYMKRKRPVLFSELASEDGTEIEFEDVNIGHLPDVLLDQQETSRLIQKIISGLSEEQQLAIGLFYFEEMPIKSIAKKLGCSENTVKSRLNYGRKNIEKQVRELEKKGTKLYSLAPLPFFLWLLRNLHSEPSQNMLGTLLAECAGLSPGAAATANHTAAKAEAKADVNAGVNAGIKAASSTAKKLTTKIVAGILAVAAIGGGAAIALSGGSSDPTPTQEIVAQTTTPIKESIPVCEADGHKWMDAVCETAKTCSVCGETEGEILGHTWIDADYQTPKTCRSCGVVDGEPLAPGFAEAGININVTGIGTEYDYITTCRKDPSKKTMGKMHIEGYAVFDSDDAHEGLDGYEWRVVTAKIFFGDENAYPYSFYVGSFHDDYYMAAPWGDTAAGEVNQYTVVYNGITYTECLNYETEEWSNWKNGTIWFTKTFHFRVPVGYDGCVVGFFDSANPFGPGSYASDVLDGNSLVFRLN